jgi:Domain of unknown function (DUF222)
MCYGDVMTPTALSEHIDTLASALGELEHAIHIVDPSSVKTNDVVALRVLLDRVDQACSESFIRFIDNGGHLLDNCLSAGAWLAEHTHVVRSEAETRRLTVRLQDELTSFGVALTLGEIGLAHVRLLARIVTKERLDIARRDEEVLLNAARTLDPSRFARALRVWQQLCDDELHDPTGADQIEARRKLRLAALADGMWRIDGDLDPATGEALATVLDQIMGKPAADDDRSIGQRRHDALGELARSVLANGDIGTCHGESAAVTVIVQANGVASTSAGMVLSKIDLGVTMCDAVINRMTVDPNGRPFDIGVFNGSIPIRNRRAVIARDHHCRAPGCDRPARWSDIHHMRHRAEGGTHHPDGLVLLCRYHHRLTHKECIDMYMDVDGVTVIFTWPDGRTARSSPMAQLWAKTQDQQSNPSADASRAGSRYEAPLAG